MSPTPDSDASVLSTSSAVETTAVVVHGHFYQPPREDPFTGDVLPEATAEPFADWNERITAECYAPLAELGVLDWVSFDLGPTLARWLERTHPSVHAAFVDGDRASRARTGHGNAIAQPYHHVILPLASRHEKELEIRWGLDDFERRFGRRAEGMWLPETAVDRPTLEALARADVAFTVLAPHQVRDPVPGGLGRVTLDGGRHIAVCVYDGDLSHGVAFGALLEGEDTWFERIEAARSSGSRLVALAADGETFGHHHRGAEAALADVLERTRTAPGLALSNFASELARAGELPEIELIEPSSWSCEHGVERWRADCGCKMAPERSSQQRWRRPLREALEALATELDDAVSEIAPELLLDPDAAIASLAAGLDPAPGGLERYASACASSPAAVERATALLEVTRDRMAMFTSCAWFFDDVAGIEPRQVLSYARHAITRLQALDPTRAKTIEAELLDRLTSAPSNDPEVADAAHVYGDGVE